MANVSIRKHLADLRVELDVAHKERDKHLQRADQITNTELKQVRKERLLHHGQVHTQHEAAIKLMKETKTAINEFESESDSIQYLGHNLNTALRGLGDVDNFLEILSERTQKISERIVNLLNSEEERAEAGCEMESAATPQ